MRANVTSTTRKLKAGDHIYKILFLTPKELPLVLRFWRKTDPRIVLRRNPVICRELGIGYFTLSIDVLHCLHLGIYLAFITSVIHLLLAVDAFETRETRQEDSANALTSLLHHWYKGYKKQLEPEALKGSTSGNHISDSMLGKADGSKLAKLKAA